MSLKFKSFVLFFKNYISVKKTENTNSILERRLWTYLASFHAPLKNHLVISAATYSVEIYTPDTNLKNVYRLKVRIVGENDEQTGENVLADPLTTPKTEVKGYVIYQTLETVFKHISKHRKES